jgi:hypothetical protein
MARGWWNGTVIAMALVFAPAAGAADRSIQCDGGIVSAGDSKVDLLGKCGPPALREARGEERAAGLVARDGVGLAQTRVLFVGVEVWTYDFGPRRFVQYVTIENGKVARVERGGYGYRAGGAGEARRVPVSTCDAIIAIGDGKLDVLERCGEPTAADLWEERIGVVAVDRAAGYGGGESITLVREVWTYNRGPRRFLRLVHFENGRVVKIEDGGYGYSD